MPRVFPCEALTAYRRSKRLAVRVRETRVSAPARSRLPARRAGAAGGRGGRARGREQALGRPLPAPLCARVAPLPLSSFPPARVLPHPLPAVGGVEPVPAGLVLLAVPWGPPGALRAAPLSGLTRCSGFWSCRVLWMIPGLKNTDTAGDWGGGSVTRSPCFCAPSSRGVWVFLLPADSHLSLEIAYLFFLIEF